MHQVNMLRSIVIWCLSIFLTFSVKGESFSVISGCVKDGMGKALSSVMVRVTLEGQTGPFVMTDVNGTYTLQIDSRQPSVIMSFSKLGYEQEKKTLENKSQRLDITLYKSAEALPEVTVTNPEMRLRGDTISFLLSAFAGKGDVSLKDALKKVPGVEISSSGEISYNGKKISNFYIEGLDLMGGKYDIATTNIPSSYVDAIEILNNHKNRKIDRDIFSDNVAMNVRLKPKAKIRPTGTYSVSAGIGKPMPLAASGAGMLFRERFQSILTLKGSDISEFSGRENNRFLNSGASDGTDYAAEILGRISASSPPLSRNRWIKPIDTSATGNIIKKTGKDATIRADIGYAFLQTKYDYSDTRMYFDGAKDVVIEQAATPQAWSHKPSLSIEYKVDKDNLFLKNSFSGKGSFTTDVIPITTFEKEIREKEQLKNFCLYDLLDASWGRGAVRWYSVTSLELNSSPEGFINVFETDLSNSSQIGNNSYLLQNARSSTFSIKERLAVMRKFRSHHLTFPLDVNYTCSKIRTALSYSPIYEENMVYSETGRNHIDGQTLKVSLSPEYDFTTPYDRFVLRATLPISLQHINWNNTGSKPSESKCTHFLTAPFLYLNYKISAKSTIWMQTSYKNSIGDILDLLTAPVMRDYMSLTYRSGLLSKTTSFNTNLHYDFKLPLSHWYVNADVSYMHTKNNLISRQNVGTGLIEISDSILPHGNDMISCTLGFSKSIRSINTKISLKGGYTLSRNKIDQNNQTVSYRGDYLYVTPSLSSRPLSWMELEYEGNFSTTYSSYLNRRQSFSSQRHDIGLSIFPLDGLQLKVNSSIIRKEVEDNHFHTLSLLDLKTAYKFKRMRYTCEIRNILNKKNYTYTIFSALDRFTYNYHLRGRELILSLEYHL